MKRTVSDKPLEDVSGNWEIASPESVREFSAVGYFFDPVCNLSNKDGLSASPFRTDDWPGTTRPIP